MILPELFVKRMQTQLGQDYPDFEQSLIQQAPISLRINLQKTNLDFNLESVSWCQSGYYLSERPVFVADPLWHSGVYYVQEASSMALEKAFLKAQSFFKEGIKVLDLCAAPGGKSTHLAALLSENDVLVANEVIKSRVGILQENLQKWGYPNIFITNNDSSDFSQIGSVFDIIVLDAPCSGEGLFRKDPNAINEWNLDNINTCELRQKRIINDIEKCLKPNGFLIYSTCTYNPGENEQQLDTFIKLGFELVDFELDNQNSAFHAFLPHQKKGEGFFIALLQKKDGNCIDNIVQPKELKKYKTTNQINELINKESQFIEWNQHVVALSDASLEFYENSLHALKIYTLGTSIIHAQDKFLNPDSKLAFSQLINQNAFETITIDREQAIQYLNKNSLQIQSSKRGFVLIKHEDFIIGLGKFAGNRINNLFPNEWRLRKQISKDEWFSILDFKK